MCFGDTSFSPPGRPLGTQSAMKGAQMKPKEIEKMVRSHLERAKRMAGTVREARGEIPKESGNHFFQERGAKLSP